MNHPPRRATLTIALCFIVALIEGFDLQSAGTAAAATYRAEGREVEYKADPSSTRRSLALSMRVCGVSFLGAHAASHASRSGRK